MNKTRRKNILRGIRGSLNRFLSILFIVALGAGFMAGLAAASPDMYDAADQYIRDYKLFDIGIRSTIGFSADDVKTISTESMIEQYQPAVVWDMVLDQSEGSDFTSRVYGILDQNGETSLNQIHLTEGRLPETTSECVVESIFGRYSGESIKIGDTLTLSEGTADYDTLSDYMADMTLTVVGICESPLNISIEGDVTTIGSGTINLNVYVREDFFSCSFFTDLFLSVKGASLLSTFEAPYEDLIQSVIEQLRPTGEMILQSRIETLEQEAQEAIDQLDLLLPHLQEIAGIQEDLAGQTANAILQTEYSAALLSSDVGLSELLKQTAQFLSESESAVVSASELLASVSNQQSSLRDTRDQISGSAWIYRVRKDLSGVNSYSSNVGKVSALAKIFPVFFFLVALLVALTTMTRLIEEKRLQIGTLKALGYTDFEILAEYLLFSFSASVLGCILGFAAGFRIFPIAINSAYKMMYHLPAMATPIRWSIVSWVAPVTIFSILLATLWTCWNEFCSLPAVLMLPKSPAAGKRIWLEHIGFIWKHLSFTYKVTCRNLFRYKKRFIMTILGVAGCSALLVTGFGIKDSVNDIIDKQFGEINRYDYQFILDEDSSVSEDPDLGQLLSDPDLILCYTQISQEAGYLYYEKQKQEINLFVPSDVSAFPRFLTLRSRKSHEPYQISSEGIILTEKICEELQIQAGDLVTLEDAQGHQQETRVLAITENYVSSYAYLTEELYRELFSSTPSYTNLLCIAPEGAPDLSNRFLAMDHVIYGRSLNSLKESFSDSINSINGVIYVLILAAGLLCIVVLYNLINVNICERKKELATLRVLGFYKLETQNYIFRETNILSFLGAAVGLIVGIWLHNFVIRTVEVNHIMFGREIKPLSFVIAMAISVVFTLLVDLIMKRPINNTDMVDAMKAND